MERKEIDKVLTMFHKKINRNIEIPENNVDKEKAIPFLINNSLYTKYQHESMNKSHFINLSSYYLKSSVTSKENILSSYSKSHFCEESLTKTPSLKTSYFFNEKFDSKNLLDSKNDSPLKPYTINDSPLKPSMKESNSKIFTKESESKNDSASEKRKSNFLVHRTSRMDGWKKKENCEQDNKIYKFLKNSEGNVSIWINKKKYSAQNVKDKIKKKNCDFSETFDLNEYFSCYINESLNRNNMTKDIEK